tara:strand:- start:6658 stop:7092 length:435 start_codon:yes stop_codon:yes gene_type:complete
VVCEVRLSLFKTSEEESRKEEEMRVRFHLAKGPNYQRWQVRDGKEVEYYDPEDVHLDMYGAKLRNHRKTADRIRSGENKTVCAWVECERIEVQPRLFDGLPDVNGFCLYNPRKAPHWCNSNNEDIDNKEYQRLMTYGRMIFIPR